MKKWTVILAAALLALTAAGCGAGNVVGQEGGQLVTEEQAQAQQEQQAQEEQQAQVTDDGYDETLDGLAAYLTAKGCLAEDAAVTEMESAFLGATAGKKYVYGFNGSDNVSVELYEFDLDHLDETANAALAAAKQDGKLTILGVEVEAYVSGSGRFLMFYTDSASEDRENSHAARKEETISLFSSFKA